MHKLKDVLQSREMFWVDAGQSVSAVAGHMAGLGVGAIVVLENGGTLKGIFSERDLMKRVVVAGLDPAGTAVREVMSTDLATIEETATVAEAMELMQRRSCRHLPVMRAGQVVGLVSMRDLMNLELEEKTEELEHIRAYIAGSS